MLLKLSAHIVACTQEAGVASHITNVAFWTPFASFLVNAFLLKDENESFFCVCIFKATAEV